MLRYFINLIKSKKKDESDDHLNLLTGLSSQPSIDLVKWENTKDHYSKKIDRLVEGCTLAAHTGKSNPKL